MDQVTYSIARGLVEADDQIEYYDLEKGKFDEENPYVLGGDQERYGKLVKEKGIRDPLGTTYHESGTLWMGEDPGSSVLNSTARFHQVENCYCCDQASFPRGGSANPVPTGLVIARRTAETIVNGPLTVVTERGQDGRILAHAYEAEPGFEPLMFFERGSTLPRGWRHIGSGSFRRIGLGVETTGGIGLLVYDPEGEDELRNFTLRLQWRAPTIRNNSGVYVRLPREHLQEVNQAIKTGYEIQIDDTGERALEPPDERFPPELFNPFHQTGAIYPVHPAIKDKPPFPPEDRLPQPNGVPSISPSPGRPLNAWNDLEVLVAENRIKVLLNGKSVLRGGIYEDARDVYPRGLLALQNHFKGFRVQFRHLRLSLETPAL